jgi:uncharacterized membrane protein
MDHQSHREPAPAFGVLSRLYWMAIGPIAIIMISIAVIMKSFENNIPISLIYWGLVFSIILIRYFDIRYFKGETADGEPATMKHWKRFCMAYLIVFVALWLVLIFLF